MTWWEIRVQCLCLGERRTRPDDLARTRSRPFLTASCARQFIKGKGKGHATKRRREKKKNSSPWLETVVPTLQRPCAGSWTTSNCNRKASNQPRTTPHDARRSSGPTRLRGLESTGPPPARHGAHPAIPPAKPAASASLKNSRAGGRRTGLRAGRRAHVDPFTSIHNSTRFNQTPLRGTRAVRKVAAAAARHGEGTLRITHMRKPRPRGIWRRPVHSKRGIAVRVATMTCPYRRRTPARVHSIATLRMRSLPRPRRTSP